MKRKHGSDERILIQSRKVLSEGYTLLMIMLLVSILVQQFLFDAPFEQYAVEFICFFGVYIYIVIRRLMLGVNLFGDKDTTKKMTLLNSLVTGFIITIMNGVLNYTKYTESAKEQLGFFIITLLIVFTCATIGSSVMLSILNHFNNKKQLQIQKRLDEEERED